METLERTRSNTLLDVVVAECERAQNDLVKATLAYNEAKRIVPFMPKVLFNQSWYIFHRIGPGEWYLETACMTEDSADKLIRQLKLSGVYGITSKLTTSNRWHYTGSFVAGGDVVTIKVDGGSKPPACRVVRCVEKREVVVYKAICEETEEEV